MSNISHSQDWFTSLDIAKRFAIVQNKMLFVMWEGSLENDYLATIEDGKGNEVVIILSESEYVTNLIWEYFVPVMLLETDYETLSTQVKDKRGFKYYNKLIDDSIKIMDVNDNILNINDTSENYENVSQYIKRYGLSTFYIKQELENYSRNKNATSSYLLASKYQDYAIFVNRSVRPEIIALADIYFDEAKLQLPESTFNNKVAFLQKLELLQIKGFLILDKSNKARRFLKKIDAETIDSVNQSLFSFLNYTMFKLLKDEENAALWKNRVSLVDLKKTELIININS